MKSILFTDLDDTLFQSKRKSTPLETCVPLAFLTDGEAISFANTVQQAALSLFLEKMVVIPVTARNFDAFNRVKINFKNEVILNYGGLVIDELHRVDEYWLEGSRCLANNSIDKLETLAQSLSEECSRRALDTKIRLISDYGVPFYLVAKSESGNLDSIKMLAEICYEYGINNTSTDLKLHINHNNLAILPTWLNKSRAVTYLREKYESNFGEVLTFGLGDSFVDLDFMKTCHFMLMPSGSQIALDIRDF